MMMMMMEEEQVSCLSTCRVKVLEISGYGGTCKELKQMRHFLGKLKYLETVKISLQIEKNDNYRQRVTNVLKKLPRLSSKCQIHFF
ncbi:F-box/LRR-repeat protein [Cardamine amara subsp. amara]|uniref:F-box/LRR-repeat protein n=1 Tax=Cardamine amara subsp. amara TaxID=228776 RepID=A0ABD0Z809_CARAN